MSSNQSFLLAAFIMFLTGIGIPIMAAMNAGLGRQLENPGAATAILFAVALTLSLAALAWYGLPSADRFAGIEAPYLAAGCFVVFYILAVTYFAPRIGLGNAVFFVLIGQLVAAAAIDHFGLLQSIRTPLTFQRGAGLVIMAIGVYLARRTV